MSLSHSPINKHNVSIKPKYIPPSTLVDVTTTEAVNDEHRRDEQSRPLLSESDQSPPCTIPLESGSLVDDECNQDLVPVENDEKDMTQREQQGLCIQCGKQLFKIKTKKKGLFNVKTKQVKVPLSIPGHVERGQCLQCLTTPISHLLNNGSGGGSSSSSNSIRNNNNNSSDPRSSQLTFLHNAAADTTPSMGNSDSTQWSQNVVYEGPFNTYGERDGVGTMTWENGDVYQGQFFNGNRHGHGILTFFDGSEYVGEWQCNQQHGVGTRRWINGDCYTGQYLKGQRTGEGRFYFANGDLYVGGWDEGTMHGFGRYYYNSGKRFEGTFCRGERHGKGKLQRSDGSVEIAVYDHDARVGTGVRWSADRTMAWKIVSGKVATKLTVPEAVAMDYDLDAAVEALSLQSSSSIV